MRGLPVGTRPPWAPASRTGIGAKFGRPGRAGHRLRRTGHADERPRRADHHSSATGSSGRPALIIAVLHNNDSTRSPGRMRAMEGAPKFTEPGAPDVSYEGFARSLACTAAAVDKPRQVGRGLGRPRRRPPDGARLQDRPDLPASRPRHPSSRQRTPPGAAKGDANRWGVLKEGLMTKAREVRPARTADQRTGRTCGNESSGELNGRADPAGPAQLSDRPAAGCLAGSRRIRRSLAISPGPLIRACTGRSRPCARARVARVLGVRTWPRRPSRPGRRGPE